MKKKKFAVCYNKNIENSNKTKDDLVHFLQKNSVTPEIFDIDNLKSGADFVFVIGGDGTILKSWRDVTVGEQVSVMLGEGGFTATVDKPLEEVTKHAGTKGHI